jgi:hypothetical protein
LVPTTSFPIDDQERTSFEYSQGDIISGRITRYELAKVILDVMDSPYSVGKTLEVRRREAAPDALAAGPPGSPASTDPVAPEICKSTNTMLSRLVKDVDRSLVLGLPAFPPALDPAAPLSEAKTKEILESDPRVKAAQERDKRESQEIVKQLDVTTPKKSA